MSSNDFNQEYGQEGFDNEDYSQVDFDNQDFNQPKFDETQFDLNYQHLPPPQHIAPPPPRNNGIDMVFPPSFMNPGLFSRTYPNPYISTLGLRPTLSMFGQAHQRTPFLHNGLPFDPSQYSSFTSDSSQVPFIQPNSLLPGQTDYATTSLSPAESAGMSLHHVGSHLFPFSGIDEMGLNAPVDTSVEDAFAASILASGLQDNNVSDPNDSQTPTANAAFILAGGFQDSGSLELGNSQTPAINAASILADDFQHEDLLDLDHLQTAAADTGADNNIVINTNVSNSDRAQYDVPTNAQAYNIAKPPQKSKVRKYKILKQTVANPGKRQIAEELDTERQESKRFKSGHHTPAYYHHVHNAFHSEDRTAAAAHNREHEEDPGRSAFLEQDLFLTSQQIMQNPSIYKNLSTVFNDQAAAQAYMSSLLEPEPTADPTLPTTPEQRRAHVAVLFQAFKSTALASDNQGALTPFTRETHDNRLVEYHLWRLLSKIETASRVRQSVQVAYGGPWQFKGHVYRNFAERFDAVRWVLAHRKGSCKNLLETPESTKLADDPLGNFDKAMGNKALNDGKKSLIALGRKRRRATGLAGEEEEEVEEEEREENGRGDGDGEGEKGKGRTKRRRVEKVTMTPAPESAGVDGGE